MKNQFCIYIRKVGIYSCVLSFAGALAFGSSIASAEDDMMGTMPKAQPQAQPSPMKENFADTMAKDHEQMKIEHDQMMKDHKKMMKKNSMAQTGEMQKMGKMKKKKMSMPMNDSDSDMMQMDSMDPMNSDKTKKPADPMPADGMDHM